MTSSRTGKAAHAGNAHKEGVERDLGARAVRRRACSASPTTTAASPSTSARSRAARARTRSPTAPRRSSTSASRRAPTASELVAALRGAADGARGHACRARASSCSGGIARHAARAHRRERGAHGRVRRLRARARARRRARRALIGGGSRREHRVGDGHPVDRRPRPARHRAFTRRTSRSRSRRSCRRRRRSRASSRRFDHSARRDDGAPSISQPGEATRRRAESIARSAMRSISPSAVGFVEHADDARHTWIVVCGVHEGRHLLEEASGVRTAEHPRAGAATVERLSLRTRSVVLHRSSSSPASAVATAVTSYP